MIAGTDNCLAGVLPCQLAHQMLKCLPQDILARESRRTSSEASHDDESKQESYGQLGLRGFPERQRAQQVRAATAPAPVPMAHGESMMAPNPGGLSAGFR